MMTIQAAAKQVKRTKETVELPYCFVCWSKSMNRVVTVPK